MSRLSRPAQIVLGVGAIAVLGYLVVVPQFISASAAARTLTGVSPLWLGAAVFAEVASLLAYARLSQHTLRPARIGFVPMLRIDLATLAVSHVTPAGFVVGAGIGFRMLTLCGVSPDRAVTGKTVQTVGSAIVLNVLLDVALVAAVVRHGTNPLYGTAAAVGVVLMVAVTTGMVLLLRNPGRGAAVIGRIASVIPSVDADAGRRLASALGDTLRLLLRDRAFRVTAFAWAAANWILDAAALWCAVRAFGHSLGPVGLLVAFGLANVFAAIPLTPGGLGIVEGVLLPVLITFDAPASVAVLGITAWRLLNFWAPIPIGLACLTVPSRPGRAHHDPMLAPARSPRTAVDE